MLTQETEIYYSFQAKLKVFLSIYKLIVSVYKCANWTSIFAMSIIFLNIWMK